MSRMNWLQKTAQKQPWEMTAFEYRWGEDVHNIRAQLSQAGREFMDAAITSSALTAIDASATMREDRTLLTGLGFSWTTDRHNVPMGKVSQNKRAEIIRRNVYHKRYVKQALAEGKSVPAEVLNDYTELIQNQGEPQRNHFLQNPGGHE